MTLEQLRDLIINELEDLKAIDILVLDVAKLTSFTDIIIIASGNSDRQVRALASNLVEAAKKNKVKTLGSEGQQDGDWVLVDMGDIVVNIMRPDAREYYQLEKLWSVDSDERNASLQP